MALLEQEEMNGSRFRFSSDDFEPNIAMPLRIPKFLVMIPFLHKINILYKEKLSNSYFKIAQEKKLNENKPIPMNAKEKKVVYKGKHIIFPKNNFAELKNKKMQAFSGPIFFLSLSKYF